MVAVGEETGDLDKMLLKIADNYDEQVDVLVAADVMLEPIMILVLGDRYDHRAVGVPADDSDYFEPWQQPGKVIKKRRNVGVNEMSHVTQRNNLRIIKEKKRMNLKTEN